MNLQEYLPFHAKLLWECAQEKNYVIIRDLSAYSTYRLQLMSVSAFERENPSVFKINSADILLKFLLEGDNHNFPVRKNICLLYAEKLFSTRENRYIDYFIENTSLLCSYDCDDLVQFLPFLDEIILDKIFTNPNSQFLFLSESAHSFDYMMSEIKKYPQHIQWINQFLQIKGIGIETSQFAYKIRDMLISVFPTQFEQFESFPLIREHLIAKKNQISPFVDHIYEKVIPISINQSVLQQLYSISGFTIDDYRNSLEYMFEGLSESEELGISRYEFNYKYNTKNTTPFQQFDILLYLNKQSNITKPILQEFIGEFYSVYLKQLIPSSQDQFMQPAKQMNDIISMAPQLFFHFMMNRNLPDNSGKSLSIKL